ncbi:MAG: DUF4105 domain-containing protein [Deltaproteobacteria bacterium]|nr:DUF4105 domain-containing protein [Deltaproteobacteria bacterium]
MLAWPLLFLLCSSSVFAHDQVALRKIADGRYWRRLVHYKKSITGASKGEASSPYFYLSPEGRFDPYKELVATLESLETNTQEVGPHRQHPQCAFPERFRYLKSQLALKFENEEVCSRFLEWKARFNPSSVTLVFATAYLGNSATMFGHTFLRVDSKPRAASRVKSDLLDYGLNFGAGTVRGGGAINALLGMTGGLPGYFSMMPYFDKVHEYSDTESRDLWEYKLSLSDEQISRMLSHAWELDGVVFPYYFFDKNCAYQLLALLEVASPDWHLTDQFFYWVIPSDTVRALKQVPGAIAEVHLRPSLYRQLKQKIEALGGQELADFKRSAGGQLALDGAESPLVLETLVDHHEYGLMHAEKQPGDADRERQRRLLVARAKLEAASPVFPAIEAGDRPDLGTSSEKISFYGGVKTGGQTYAGLRLRPGFHDLLDLDAGYLPFSEVALLAADLRYYASARQFRVYELQAVALTSLPSVNLVNHGLSWTTNDGLYSPGDLDCKNCVAGRLSGGLGYSAEVFPGSENVLVSALFKGNVEYSGWFAGNVRLGPSFLTQALVDISDFGKGGLSGEVFYYPTQPRQTRVFEKFAAQLSLNPLVSFSNNIELRAAAAYYFRSQGNALDLTGSLSFFL